MGPGGEVRHHELQDQTGPGKVYIRPHVLTIETEPGERGSFPARVLHVSPAGPIVKVELVTPWGETARVEMARERFDPQQLSPGVTVFLRPLSEAVFVVPSSSSRLSGH